VGSSLLINRVRGSFSNNNVGEVSLEFAEVQIESQEGKCQSDADESQACDAEKGCRLDGYHPQLEHTLSDGHLTPLPHQRSAVGA